MEVVGLIEIVVNLFDGKNWKGLKFNSFNNAASSLGKIIGLLTPFQEVGNGLDWWSAADNYKNRGFYVDYRNELLLPEEVKEEDYKHAVLVVKGLKKRFRTIKVLLEEMDDKGKKEFAEKVNKGLDLYLENNKEASGGYTVGTK